MTAILLGNKPFVLSRLKEFEKDYLLFTCQISFPIMAIKEPAKTMRSKYNLLSPFECILENPLIVLFT
jgi:hypothetical protein